MPTSILSIQPRAVDFRTQTNTDWLDGLLIWQAGQGGIIAGVANSGNAELVVAAVAPTTALGAHVVTVSSTEGMTRLTVTDPSGDVTAQGVAGLPVYAGGITFTLTEGSSPSAVGDTYAIGVLPEAVDLTGIAFELQARLSQTSANVALSASSAPADGSLPTIISGGVGGQVAMRVLRSALTRERFPPQTYVYDLIAIADGVRVPAFYGTIEHLDGVTFLP